MNRREHLLTILQEECAEVIQCVSKIKRFGLENYQPATGKRNIDILRDELNDILAMIYMLEEDGVSLKPHVPDANKIKQKKEKVETYLIVSEDEGCLI